LCIKAQGKSASFSSEYEFSGRGAAEAEQAMTKGTFWQRSTLNFLERLHELQPKDTIGEITNLFCIYLFQIGTFINTYILIFFMVFAISLLYYLQYNHNS
jgi:hypothetical protein